MVTKKITLNELRSIIKQIIKEEKMLNESDDVDFKLTELKNPKVSELKKMMVEKGLKVYYKIAGKEYKYEAPTTGSGWDAKKGSSIHDSYMYWNGNSDGVIMVGIGKNTNKAQDILKFIEDTFKDGYVIKKGGSGDYWEIRIEPSAQQTTQQQPVSENLRLRNYFR